ncbi:MAG: phosphate transporter, inner rane subunit PstC, partial [Mycobacterium sp.]|nr:phosphate transporter, inner rane subunit PstC [Mycobacterium sp.]
MGALLGSVFGLGALLVWQSLLVWQHEGPGYLTGTKWFFRQHQFGALPMIYGSAVLSLVALALAAPLGLGAAIFTAEYLPRSARL